MARAIASETNAITLVLEPNDNLIEICKDKTRKECQMLLYHVFKVAKTLQPAIIILEDIEQFFPGKKKGKKKSVVGKLTKLKRDLILCVKKFITPEDKVTIIATSYRPAEANVRELQKFFNKCFYFPFPDYNSRILLIKHLVKKSGAILDDNFPLTTFAHVTKGYTCSSYMQALNTILTNRRKKQLDMRPLTMEDFVEPLSWGDYVWNEDYILM